MNHLEGLENFYHAEVITRIWKLPFLYLHVHHQNECNVFGNKKIWSWKKVYEGLPLNKKLLYIPPTQVIMERLEGNFINNIRNCNDHVFN